MPITLLLPDLNAEQIILIHMVEYYLQCCLQGNLKHRLVQTVGSQWSTYPLVRVIPQHQKAVLRGLQEQFFVKYFLGLSKLTLELAMINLKYDLFKVISFFISPNFISF